LGFDIRLPIGLLFSLIGVLLLIEGGLDGASAAPGSRGLQVNLWWGAAMLGFGLLALTLARRANRRHAQAR
jgi:hypothetical protein